VTYTSVIRTRPVEVKALDSVHRAERPRRPRGVDSRRKASTLDVSGLARPADLALIVSRDVTTRRSTSSSLSTSASRAPRQTAHGRQALRRGSSPALSGRPDPRPRRHGGPRAGRRVIAQVMHEPGVRNLPNPGGPPGSVRLGIDGSMAAFVPARRAMTWHISDRAGTPVVRSVLAHVPAAARLHVLRPLEPRSGRTAEPVNAPEALRSVVRCCRDILDPPPLDHIATKAYTLPPCRLVDTRNAAGPSGSRLSRHGASASSADERVRRPRGRQVSP
jgi:hypothetical protein